MYVFQNYRTLDYKEGRHLARKSREFRDIIKIGRTHLQDAIPIRLGQEFGGYARQVELGIGRIKATEESLSELAIGGTSVGSGVNAHPEFAGRVIALILAETGCRFIESNNHFAAQAAQDTALETSSTLKGLAVSVSKVANEAYWTGKTIREVALDSKLLTAKEVEAALSRIYSSP